jgi:hypothetical protein
MDKYQSIRLVPVASARPLGATARLPGATTRHRGRGSRTGRWGWRLPGPSGTARAGARPGGSAWWYRLPLGPADDSDAAACDWSI